MLRHFLIVPLALGLCAAHAQTTHPVNLEGRGESGLTVRLTGITAHEDYTSLDVAISFANARRPAGIELAQVESLLQTDLGDRLMVQRAGADDHLPIANNATLEGTLNFQGALPQGTGKLTLILNEGRSANHSGAPTLEMDIPLPAGAHSAVSSVSHGLTENSRYPVQASNEGGLTVQVKSLRSEAGNTHLDVSMAFSSQRRPDGAELAGASGGTYLRVNGSDKLPLQSRADNPTLHIANHDAVRGELIFQGSIPADAQSLELVINDEQSATHSRAPGLIVPLPLP